MHLWKKISSAYHLPAALELSENLYDLSSEKRHWDISTFYGSFSQFFPKVVELAGSTEEPADNIPVV